MKKLSRLGANLLLVGISLFMITTLRASSPYSFPTRVSMPSDSWSMLNPELWSPRNFRLEVSSKVLIDIFVLDRDGIELWEEQEMLRPLFSFNATEHKIHNVELSKRGKFALLIHNPSDSNVDVMLSTTLYGLENDLLLASTTMSIFGIIIFLSAKVKYRKKR